MAKFLTIPKGVNAGKPFIIEPFQRSILKALFPSRGLRPRQALTSLARGNSKSTTAPALALYCMFGDEVEAAQVLCVASDLRQAMIVFSAAARKVRLTMVESTLEGDLDVQGAMGVNTEDFRNGFTAIRMHIRIAGDAPAEKLRTVVARGTDRSVVFDSISNGVPISVDVDTV